MDILLEYLPNTRGIHLRCDSAIVGADTHLDRGTKAQRRCGGSEAIGISDTVKGCDYVYIFHLCM